jgi:hypothetical protein
MNLKNLEEKAAENVLIITRTTWAGTGKKGGETKGQEWQNHIHVWITYIHVCKLWDIYVSRGFTVPISKKNALRGSDVSRKGVASRDAPFKTAFHKKKGLHEINW